MKTLLTLLLIVPFFTMTAQPKVHEIEPVPNGEISYSGNLNTGIIMDDLSWAWSSQNACFPETQKKKFTGKHVFFTGVIPKYSEMEVTVIPKDKSKNFSIYAYEIGVDNMRLVPNLDRCIRCEAGHKWDRAVRGKTQDHTRRVTDLIAINRPYRVVIGVTGAEGLSEGDFTLKVTMKTR